VRGSFWAGGEGRAADVAAPGAGAFDRGGAPARAGLRGAAGAAVGPKTSPFTSRACAHCPSSRVMSMSGSSSPRRAMAFTSAASNGPSTGDDWVRMIQ